MRNPQTFEWMLSNPEYRKQLEGMMQQQVDACPRVQGMMLAHALAYGFAVAHAVQPSTPCTT